MIPGSAVGAIHRLAFVITEDDAQALIAEAIRRGATAEDATEALHLWRTMRAAAVQRMGGQQNGVDTPCIIWTGSVNTSGYGYLKLERRSQLAHRVAYAKRHGPIPPGLTIDHLCYVPLCVNVDHMRLLTARDNRRCQRSALKTHCKNGHQYTPENTYWRPSASGGQRDCRACIRDRVRRYKARRDAA